MGKILNYNDFLIYEAMFFMLEDFESIIDKISTSYNDNKNINKIAIILLNTRYEEYDNLNISYFGVGNSNKTIKFYDPEKVKKRGTEGSKYSEITMGKFIRKVLTIVDEIDNFSDKDIEDFVNIYKSFYDFNIKRESGFELMSPSKGLPLAFDTYNFKNMKGTLGNSCMNNEEEKLKYYEKHTKDNLQILVLKTPDNEVLGRALVWNTNVGMFMDRIYTIHDSDINLFKNYAKNNKWMYKEKQSYKSNKIMTPNDNYNKGNNIELKVNVDKLDKRDFKSDSKLLFPYLDTLKYFYWESGILSNFPSQNKYGLFIQLINTDGEWTCYKCDGDGEIDCEECSPLYKLLYFQE